MRKEKGKRGKGKGRKKVKTKREKEEEKKKILFEPFLEDRLATGIGFFLFSSFASLLLWWLGEEGERGKERKERGKRRGKVRGKEKKSKRKKKKKKKKSTLTHNYLIILLSFVQGSCYWKEMVRRQEGERKQEEEEKMDGGKRGQERRGREVEREGGKRGEGEREGEKQTAILRGRQGQNFLFVSNKITI